ncbi:MAG: hypothetical protein AB1643_00980 [Patescibacteria group bacterium]
MKKFTIFFVLFLSSSFLLDLAFEKSNFWILVLIGLIPLFLFIEWSKNWKRAFWGGWLQGMIFFGISFRWLFSIFPNETLGLTSDLKGYLFIFFVWFILFTSSAFAFGLFAGTVNCKIS